MNAPRDQRPLPDQQLFDRLADGELGERQRQALLSTLDRTPGPLAAVRVGTARGPMLAQ